MPPQPPSPRPWLKVCGLRQPQQAAAVARLGADAIGVIAVSASPRHLEPDRRPALFAALAAAHPACLGVLVVADPQGADLPELMADRGHRVVQLHGDETVQRCRQLRRELGPELQLWKALRIRHPDDLRRAEAYAGCVDALLLDAWVPDQLGGTGHRIPIEWLQGFRPALPWWLAGGLSPERIAPSLQALAGCCPDGIDVSSGVERAPGDKDLALVADLVTALAPFRQDHHS
ncbi:MAG: phosphoribosylanthranilate isomerase [Synechococcaceae bacterium WBB_10_009]|jgi:phosphoribosylanthranilate isomerase|nr:phosphoribosylanthranilate isomerase [Synechococcaceae bacterium WBB_10_009]